MRRCVCVCGVCGCGEAFTKLVKALYVNGQRLTTTEMDSNMTNRR